MKYDGFVFGERWAETRVQEEHRLAEARRLAREARGGRRNWLAQRWIDVLCRLGSQLEELGQKMQERASLPPLPQGSSGK